MGKQTIPQLKQGMLAVGSMMVLMMFISISAERAYADVCAKVHLSDGCVETVDIEQNAVRSNKIKNQQVRSSDIRNGTIVNDDISPTAAIAAGKIADGPGSGLNADMLDGKDASALAVLVWADTDTAGGGTNLYGSAAVEVNSVSINPPIDGYIIVSGSAFVNNEDSSAIAYILNPLVDGSSPYGHSFMAYFYAAANNAIVSENFSLSYTITIPITAGSHTVSQVLGPYTGTSDFFYNKNNLTALFIPGGLGSVTPAALMPANTEASFPEDGK